MLVVVIGNYASGKTTYVREHARPGVDIVVDFDDLSQAFGSDAQHGHRDQYVTITQRARGVAIQAAMAYAQDPDITVYIVDGSIPTNRLETYRQHNAHIVDMATPPDECHRRADAAGRPADWHRLIDEWTPTREPYASAQRKAWPKTPGHRRATKTRQYKAARAAFLAQYTNCQYCGRSFVTDAPCEHPTCLRRGKGCQFNPDYPTVQHLVRLADGGVSMDRSTWAAWCLRDNTSDGGRFSAERRAERRGDRSAASVDLDW